jgi:hypothetical protein
LTKILESEALEWLFRNQYAVYTASEACSGLHDESVLKGNIIQFAGFAYDLVVI